MNELEQKISTLLEHKNSAEIRVQTLGGFQVWRGDEVISPKEWGRDKTIQLFEFFVTARHRRGLHKEQIVDRLWEESTDQNFKVALHGINKTLEPHRKSRTEPKYISRQGLTYQLNLKEVWIDVQALEDFIEIGNISVLENPEIAKKAYREAVNLYHGIYLPNRLYEDWSSAERERIQVLVLNAFIALGELLVEENPVESIRLAQKALQIDSAWEDAYRIQMEAYYEKGNRPMAIKTYRQCEEVLEEEFGVKPLPETRKLLEKITSN